MDVRFLNNIKKILDSIFINSFFLISSTFITSILGFVFWIVAARLSDPYDVGLTSILISSMNIVAFLSLFGFNISIIRYIPNSNNVFRLINTSIFSSILGGFVFVILFIAGIDIWAPSLSIYFKGNYLNSILFIFFTEVWIITTLLSSIYIGNRKGNLVFYKETTFGVSKLLLLFPLVILGAEGIFSSWGLGIFIGLVIGFFFLFRIYPDYSVKKPIDLHLLRSVFSYSFSNYLSWLFSYLPLYGLPIMISSILTTADSAYFYISWMISNLLLTIPTQIAQAFFAEVSHDETTIQKNLIKSIKISFPLIIIGIIFLLVIGDKILLLFGQSYTNNGYILLQLLSISVIPYLINTLFLSVKKIYKNNISIILIPGAIAGITLIGSFFSLGTFGLIGAGISWFFANLIVALLLLLGSIRQIKLLFIHN